MTDLVATGRGPSSSFDGRGGRRAQWLGSVLHVRHQDRCTAADPTYRAEVPLQRTQSFAGWTLELRGRCDGLSRASEDTWWIDELKSGRLAPSPGSETARAFALQASLYAWMAEDTLGARVRARWVWLPFDGGPSISTDVPWHERDLMRRVGEIVQQIAEDAERREATLAARRGAASSVVFPFAKRRAGQEDIEEAVEAALDHGEHLLLEAPTGLGKTAAVLTPVLRHVLANDRRAFIASANTLQQHGTRDLLRAIAPKDLCTAVQLRAKSGMCATGTLRCHPQLCTYADGYAQRRDAGAWVAECLAQGPVVRPERLFELGERAHCCPFELSLDAADETPVTFGDVNYLIDPVVQLPAWSDPERLGDAVLVIDEAHQLPARARDSRSVRLSLEAVREVEALIALGGSPLHHRLRELAHDVASWIDEEAAVALADASGVARHDPESERASSLLDALDAGVGETLDRLEGAPAEGPLAAFLGLAWEVTRLREPAAGVYTGVATRLGADATLERWCLDAAPAIAPAFAASHATIALSATLSPPESHQRLLGFDRDRTRAAQVAGANLGERLRVVIDPRFSTRYKHRATQTPKILRAIDRVVDAMPGNVLVAVSSFAGVERAAQGLAPRRHGVIRQWPEQDETERAALLEELRGRDDRVLVAVAGGALAEGVDTAGLGLSGVIIVGPCLPALDDVTQLRIEHHDEECGDGFELAVAIPGMTRVIQTAGRLLRRDDDRGVVVLIGDRFLRSPYRDALPEAWTRGGEVDDLVANPEEAVEAFFGS